MSKNKLAIHGGEPTIPHSLAHFKTIGSDEIKAVTAVMEKGVLSAYIGAAGPGFMGGESVKTFEARSAEYFGVKHAISVNSWTSGLIAAVGAIGVEPGDEIITTPWTMSATATAIVHWNCIPVFADIDRETFNICPESVEQNITDKTVAILAADIFGQSADLKYLRAIADRHKLKIICDTAQSPGAFFGDKLAGTLADIGGFSLNYHKHIHCGEGGLLVTDDDELARKLCLIRNHAESVVGADDIPDLVNMVGYNFRMGEIEAAIATSQIDKLESRVSSRQRIASELNDGLRDLGGLRLPKVSSGSSHAYYVYGMELDLAYLGVPREKIASALLAEGVPGLMQGYQNIHRLPMFEQKIAFGSSGFPWKNADGESSVKYGIGVCPIAEKLHDETFLGLNICLNELPKHEVDLIVEAFKKVWLNLDELKTT